MSPNPIAQSSGNTGCYAPQKNSEQLPESVLTREKQGYLDPRTTQAKFEFLLDERVRVNNDIQFVANGIYGPIGDTLAELCQLLQGLLSQEAVLNPLPTGHTVMAKSRVALGRINAVITLPIIAWNDQSWIKWMSDNASRSVLHDAEQSLADLKQVVEPFRKPLQGEQHVALYCQQLSDLLEKLAYELERWPDAYRLSNIMASEFVLATPQAQDAAGNLQSDLVEIRDQLYTNYGRDLTSDIVSAYNEVISTLKAINVTLAAMEKIRDGRVKGAMTAIELALKAAHEALIPAQEETYATPIDSAVEIVRSALKAFKTAPPAIRERTRAVGLPAKWPAGDEVILLREYVADSDDPFADEGRFKSIDKLTGTLATALECVEAAMVRVDTLTTTNLTEICSEYGCYCVEVALGALNALRETSLDKDDAQYTAEHAATLHAFEDALEKLEQVLHGDSEVVKGDWQKGLMMLNKHKQTLHRHQCALIMQSTKLQNLKKLLLLFERKHLLARLTSPDTALMHKIDDNDRLLNIVSGKAKVAQRTMGGGERENLTPVGLAFSGGGMRSASYNLGLMQGLSEMGILPDVDYLTTVSGGGYLGGCATSLLSSQAPNGSKSPSQSAMLTAVKPNVTGKGSASEDFGKYIDQAKYPFSVHWPKFPFNPHIRVFKATDDRVEVSVEDGPNAQLAHLRNQGNILIPRMGWTNRDVLRAVGGFLGGVSYTLMTVLLALFVVAGAVYIIFAGLSPTLMLSNGVQVIPNVPKAAQEPVTLSVDGGKVIMNTSPPPDSFTVAVADALAATADASTDTLTLTLSNEALALAISPPAIDTDKSITADETKDAKTKATDSTKATGKPGYAQSDDDNSAFLALPSLPDALDQGVTRRQLLHVSTHEWGGNDQGWHMPLEKYGLIALLGALFASLVACVFLWWQHPQRKAPSTNPLGEMLGEGRSWEEHEDSRNLGRISWLYVITLLIAVFTVHYMSGNAAPFGPQVFWIWLPFSFAIGAWVGLLIFRTYDDQLGKFISRQAEHNNSTTTPEHRLGLGYIRYRTLYWSFQGVCLYALVIILVLTLMIIPFFFDVPNAKGPGAIGPLATTTLTAIAASLLSRFVGGKSEKQLQDMWKKWLPPAFHGGLLLYLLGFLVLFLNLSLIYLGLIVYDQVLVRWSIGGVLWGVVGATALLLILAKVVNFNYISPHYFYRDRLGDAFLKTELEINEGNLSGVVKPARDHRDLWLKHINPKNCSAPYHLVVTALNLPGTWRMKYKDRRAVHFILSRFYCGSSVTGYVDTETYRTGITKLSRSMALSGAAVSANVGFRTFFAQAFMLTLLNVRLGLWMVNPRQYGQPSQKSGGGTSVNSGKIEHPSWLPYLWDEVRGRISERRKMVSLSDGAHNGDGNGLMPLLERRCKIIIVGDANEDPDYRFESLFRAIYQAKTDLDIDVYIDVTPLQPEDEPEEGKTGVCKNHYVIGKIIYPAIEDGEPPLAQTEGWLIYFKPAITEHVPSEIRQYWATHKELFPQVTTADVFFDEEQIEAYRHIGEFSVKHAYERILLQHYRQNWRYPSRKINQRFHDLYLRELGADGRCGYLGELFKVMLPRWEMGCDDRGTSVVGMMAGVESEQNPQAAAKQLVADEEFIAKFEAVELREVEESGINFYRLRVSPFAQDIIDDLKTACDPATAPVAATPSLQSQPPQLQPTDDGAHELSAMMATPATLPKTTLSPTPTLRKSTWSPEQYRH